MNDMRRFKILFIDTCLWIGGKVAYALFSLLGWRFVHWTGRWVGNGVALVDSGRRDWAHRQCHEAFDLEFAPEKVSAVVRESFQHYYMRQMEMLFFGAMTRPRTDKIARAERLQHLDEALSRGKGIILLLNHFGSYLLPLPFLGHRGYKVNQIAGKEISHSVLAERVQRWRKQEADKLPIKFVPVGTFLRPIFRALGENEIVVIAFDGVDASKWVVVDFLDKKVRFSPGPFQLARRTGAEIIPTFVIRQPAGWHQIILHEAFKLSQASDEDAASAEDTQRFADICAEYVKSHPVQLALHLHSRYKRGPSGENLPFFLESQP